MNKSHLLLPPTGIPSVDIQGTRLHDSYDYNCRDTIRRQYDAQERIISNKRQPSEENEDEKGRRSKATQATFIPSDSHSYLRCKRRSYHGVGIPTFHPASPTNITAQLGANAYLPCRIRNLGNKSVSEPI